MADWADEKARVLFSECRTAEGYIEKEVARQMIADALRAVCAETTARVVKRCVEIASAKAHEFQADGMSDFGRYNHAVGVCGEIAAEIRAEKWEKRIDAIP